MNLARQIRGHSKIGVRFRSDHCFDPALQETLLQARTHSRSDQHADAVERVQRAGGSRVKRLLNRQFEQFFADYLPLADFENPELPAFAGVFRHRLAVLATDGNPEVLAARPVRNSRLPRTAACATFAALVFIATLAAS